MNYKKKSIILSVFIIISIQFFLLNNNRQKTSFRYFIWNIENVSIGKLICVSFISGLLLSSLLNKTLNNNFKTFPQNEDDDVKTNDENNYPINKELNNDTYEMPPERDLRDIQPTISVNYRVIKDNGENELKDRKKTTNKTQYQDDWNNNDSEW